MDPRQELHTLVAEKLWQIGAEAMELLVTLCRIVEPSIPADSIVPALSDMFSMLPKWLEEVSENDLLALAEKPPPQAMHFRLLLALRGLGIFLGQLTGRQLEQFYLHVPEGQQEYKLEFLLQVQQVVNSWSMERIHSMREQLSALADHMRPQQVLCMNPSVDYITLEILSRILCLDEQELLGFLQWFPSLTRETMAQFVALISEVPFESVVELRARLAPPAALADAPPTPSSAASTPTMGAASTSSSSPAAHPSSPAFGEPPSPSALFGDAVIAPDDLLPSATMLGNEMDMFGGIVAARIRIIEQPPSQTVYQRLLKPHPKVMLENATSDDLWVEARLIRQDSEREIEGKCVDGTTTHHISRGKVAVFGKLKLMFTSQQQGTLFRLKFVLKRYTGTGFEEIPSGTAISNPIEVFSHSHYIKRPRHATPPVINEVLPNFAHAGQSSRVCIIGSNFNNSMTICVRIGDVVLSGQDAAFHGTGTLLVNAPPLPSGTYGLSVSNDGSNFCEPVDFIVH
eukprot:TRINITY_DN16519_c0_g1_i1.p1 TRINITY_DN16519_c0_g1~~TRINITY_DN16519_c0_g1_i1.p1  ORF type:complete len:586 (+),score=114.74 TRINITY_DN16519_c0_g1_i1:217-1758(+)